MKWTGQRKRIDRKGRGKGRSVSLPRGDKIGMTRGMDDVFSENAQNSRFRSIHYTSEVATVKDPQVT